MKAIRRQLEYYFGEDNFRKDKYIQGRINSDGFMNLNDVMSFNKMRKLTKSAD